MGHVCHGCGVCGVCKLIVWVLYVCHSCVYVWVGGVVCECKVMVWVLYVSWYRYGYYVCHGCVCGGDGLLCKFMVCVLPVSRLCVGGVCVMVMCTCDMCCGVFTYAVGRSMSHWCVSRGWCCLCTHLTKSGCGLNSISLEFTGNEVTLKQLFLELP